jgi:hypothetical protein
MKLKLVALVLLSLLLNGCYEAGYHPSYIISHEEEVVEEPCEEKQQL